ncbi:MAG: hypothetical protein ACAI38_19660 [Myxococcota bacterium]|nr:hypothetical protein [Myxococcota bacterium]
MLASAHLTRENLGTLSEVLGPYVGTKMDATTQTRVAQELTARFGTPVTAAELPSLVRGYAAIADRVASQDARQADVGKRFGGTLVASSTRDDRRSRWNAKGPLAFLMRATTSTFPMETLTSAVMRTAALGDMARAVLAGTAKAARAGLAAGLVLGTLGGAVSTAAFAQELGTAGQAQVRAMPARDLEDAGARLSRGQNVYVIGNIDARHNLDSLESYLRRHAPSVTVIAVERADRDNAGIRQFVDTWLAQAPAVRSRVDAQSGQNNAVIMVVSFGNSAGPNKRSFTYAAGEYYARRGFATSVDVESVFKRPGADASIDTRVRAVVNHINGGVERPAIAAGAPSVSPAQPSVSAEGLSTQTTILSGVGILGAGLALLVGLAHLRRRRAGKEAQERIASVEQKLELTLTTYAQQLDALRQKVSDDPQALVDRFAGQSDQVAEQIVRDIGELAVAQGSARFLLSEAKALVARDAARSAAASFLSSQDLRAAVATLTDREVQISPRPEIQLALGETVGSPQWLVAIQDNLKGFAPFTASSNKLLASIDQLGKRAAKNTDELAAALATGGNFTELETEKTDLIQLVRDLDRKAPDGQFRVPLTPITTAISATLEAARAEWSSNPVGAVNGVGATASRMLQETAALTHAGIEARDVTLPALTAAKAKLAASEVDTAWLDTAIAALSRDVTKIAGQIPDGSVKNDIDRLTAALSRLVARAENAVTLNERRTGRAATDIATATQNVDGARAELAVKLRIAPERMLREDGFDPSARLAEASTSLAQSKPALDIGDIEAATTALADVDARVKEANDLVDEARFTVAKHAENLRAFTEEERVLGPAVDDHLGLAGELRRMYAPHVVRELDGVDIAMGDAFQAGYSAVHSADPLFRRGALIGASRALLTAEQHFATVRTNMERIGRVAQALEAADRANAEAAQVAVLAYTTAAQLAANGVTSSTMALITNSQLAVTMAAAGLNAGGRDPEAVAREIASAHMLVQSAASAVTVDLTPPPPPEPEPVSTTTFGTSGGSTDTVEQAPASAPAEVSQATTSEF